MKFRWTTGLGIATFCVLAAGAAAQNGAGDPYAPLRLYEGAWEVHVSVPQKRTDKIVNHCAKTGTFFSCEQEVNGKTTSLVVYFAQWYNGERNATVPNAGAATGCQHAAGVEPTGDRGRHLGLFVGQQESGEDHTLAEHKSLYGQGPNPL